MNAVDEAEANRPVCPVHGRTFMAEGRDDGRWACRWSTNGYADPPVCRHWLNREIDLTRTQLVDRVLCIALPALIIAVLLIEGALFNWAYS